MPVASSAWSETGLDVINLPDNVEFLSRKIHRHTAIDQMEALERLAQVFVERPEGMLQELVNVAVKLCGADSAGVSVVREHPTDEQHFEWIATAGQYNQFLGAVLPKYPSACSLTLERGTPQVFRVGKRFFDIMGITAPLITDGLLFPWKIDDIRGTIFVMAHHRDEAFDSDDYRVMQSLANFAAMAVRQQKQQKLLVEQAAAASAAAMANKLAHRINNPLQSLTNQLFLASSGHNGEAARIVGEQALGDLERLSALVRRLLALPYGENE